MLKVNEYSDSQVNHEETILATLGVSAMEYAPYAILNFVVPIISIIYGCVEFAIVKMTPEEIKAAEQRKKKQRNNFLIT